MTITRRSLLATGGLGAVGVVGWPAVSHARDLSSAEKANVQVVQQFSAAWATGDVGKITGYLADDCVVRFLQNQEPVTGRAAVAQRLTTGLQNSKVEFEVHETFAAGALVANLRDDYITNKEGKKNKVRVAGVFFVRGGKIVEWVDSVVENA
jgi:limonene-1,2-epoxide hydrolase